MRHLHLQDGLVALISDVDHERCRNYCWRAETNNASGKPYVRATPRINGRKKTIYLHRFIVGGIVALPETMKVDHRNNDTLDCQRPNLRIATFNENNYNRCGFGASGYKGVVREKSGRWRARITFNGVLTYLGIHSTAIEAAMAYDEAAVERFGEFAWLNFPENHPPPDHDIPDLEIPFP